MLLKKNDAPQSHYDVIVIGGGLGGLTAANILGKCQRKVLLLEAHNKLGGLATWFFRSGGHTFDVSLHGFPQGMVKTCRKYWNSEIASDIVPLESVRFINPQFSLDTHFTREDFTRILVEKFQIPQERVLNFYDHLSKMNFYDDQSLTTGQLFEQYFPGRSDVVRLLMEPITYANGSTLEDPAISYGIVFSNFMKKGVYTFRGGTDQLIHKMKEELLRNQVDIKLHSPVQKILVKKNQQQQNQIYGVQVQGRTVYAPVVISNANILTTIFELVGSEYFSSEYIAASKKVRLNSSSCQVYMGIKEGESIPFVGDLIFTSTAPTFNTEMLLDPKISSRTFSFYYPEIRPHIPTPRYAIVSSTNARFEDWEQLTPEEYEKAKQEMIDDTLESIEKIIPGVRQKIEIIDAATPRTVMRYTRHPQGCSFGTKFEGLQISQTLPQQIAGLYHSGSVGIIMSGWLGAANYGVIVANEVEGFLYSQQSWQDFSTATATTTTTTTNSMQHIHIHDHEQVQDQDHAPTSEMSR